MFRAAGLVLVGLMLSPARTGPASAGSQSAPHRVVLEYRRLGGAERCPTRADLEAQVSAILGRRPFVQRAPHTVRCTLRGEGDTIAARVELVDSRSGRQLGIRELSARSCQVQPGLRCAELQRRMHGAPQLRDQLLGDELQLQL